MDTVRFDIHVPEGWACWMDLARTPHGTYAGLAELRHQGIARCALVITRQLSREAALQRATVRADHFVRQWVPQRSQGVDGSGPTVPGGA
ncbi:hypothetical protein J2W23_001588 [Variovorax boronicumulans]|uniref:hypothetical protein n=1 Tax=Variovorax boronicumulans TaxID=436515 RepID=UPI002783D766|nr:hypothetical protein [Variovorax boronicumulans]MDQ0013209.1 hypothetical protein [Variovorax boronicumulans]